MVGHNIIDEQSEVGTLPLVLQGGAYLQEKSINSVPQWLMFLLAALKAHGRERSFVATVPAGTDIPMGS